MVTGARGRRVRIPRIERVNASEDKFLIGRRARRSQTGTIKGNREVTLTTGHGSMVKTFTKSADAKNSIVGSYARRHKVVNPDGTITYSKRSGGTVTVKEGLSNDAKKYTGNRPVGPLGRRGRGRSRGNTGRNGQPMGPPTTTPPPPPKKYKRGGEDRGTP